MLTTHLLGDGFLPVLCWSLVCWMLGVGWAAYRAVGWVERMRSWAHSVPPIHEEESAGGLSSFSGAPLVGARRSAVRGLLEEDS